MHLHFIKCLDAVKNRNLVQKEEGKKYEIVSGRQIFTKEISNESIYLKIIRKVNFFPKSKPKLIVWIVFYRIFYVFSDYCKSKCIYI